MTIVKGPPENKSFDAIEIKFNVRNQPWQYQMTQSRGNNGISYGRCFSNWLLRQATVVAQFSITQRSRNSDVFLPMLLNFVVQPTVMPQMVLAIIKFFSNRLDASDKRSSYSIISDRVQRSRSEEEKSRETRLEENLTAFLNFTFKPWRWVSS